MKDNFIFFRTFLILIYCSLVNISHVNAQASTTINVFSFLHLNSGSSAELRSSVPADGKDYQIMRQQITDLKKGDILFTTSGTIGRVAIVKDSDLPLLMNTSVVRFRTLDPEKLDNKYLYQILKSSKFVNELKRK
jgi:restriction endonuclease S subunit